MEAGIEGIVAGDYFKIVPTGRSGGGGQVGKTHNQSFSSDPLCSNMNMLLVPRECCWSVCVTSLVHKTYLSNPSDISCSTFSSIMALLITFQNYSFPFIFQVKVLPASACGEEYYKAARCSFKTLLFKAQRTDSTFLVYNFNRFFATQFLMMQSWYCYFQLWHFLKCVW